VRVDQLVEVLDGLRHLVTVILHHEAYLAAVNAARLVDFIEHHLGGLDRADVEGGENTGQVAIRSDDDLVVADALRCMRRASHPGRETERKERLAENMFHFSSSCFDVSSAGLSHTSRR